MEVVRMSSRTLTLVAFAAALGVACGGGASDSPGPTDLGPTGPSVPTETFFHPAGTPSAKVLIADAPHGIDVSSTGIVYVTTLFGTSLARFPLDAPSVTLPPIDLTTELSDVVVNGAGTVAYLGVPAGAASVIYAVDVTSGVVKSVLPIGSTPYHIILSRDESQLFTAAAGARVWSTPIDGSKASFAQLSGVTSTVAVSPTGGGLYAANLNGLVRRLDAATLAVQETSIGLGTLGDIVVSPDGAEVYVVNDDGVVVLATSTLAYSGFVSVGDGVRGMSMSPDGEQLYVTTIYGQLVIVDRVRRSIVKRLALGGVPAHVAFDRLGKTAVVANEYGWVDIIK
jgi:DNA-binding beta-propeller fold protein YncE